MSDFWSVAAILGFWGWVAATLIFILKAFPRAGEFRTGQARIWGLFSLVCACCWVIALRSA